MLRQLRWYGIVFVGPLFLIISFFLLGVLAEARWLVAGASVTLIIGMALHIALQQWRIGRGKPTNPSLSLFIFAVFISLYLITYYTWSLYQDDTSLIAFFVMSITPLNQWFFTIVAVTWDFSWVDGEWNAACWSERIPPNTQKILTFIIVGILIFLVSYTSDADFWRIIKIPPKQNIKQADLTMTTLVIGWLVALDLGLKIPLLRVPYQGNAPRNRLLLRGALFLLLHVPIVVLGHPEVLIISLLAATGPVAYWILKDHQYQLTREIFTNSSQIPQNITRLEEIIQNLPETKIQESLQVYFYLYWLHRYEDCPAKAYQVAESAYSCAKVFKDVLSQTEALNMMADLNVEEKPEFAIEQWTQALDLVRQQHNNKRGDQKAGMVTGLPEAGYLYGIAYTHARHDRPQEALNALDEMNAVFRDPQRVYPLGVWRDVTAGEAYLALGQLDEAQAALARAEDYRRTIDTRGLATRELREKDAQLEQLVHRLSVGGSPEKHAD